MAPEETVISFVSGIRTGGFKGRVRGKRLTDQLGGFLRGVLADVGELCHLISISVDGGFGWEGGNAYRHR